MTPKFSVKIIHEPEVPNLFEFLHEVAFPTRSHEVVPTRMAVETTTRRVKLDDGISLQANKLMALMAHYGL